MQLPAGKDLKYVPKLPTEYQCRKNDHLCQGNKNKIFPLPKPPLLTRGLVPVEVNKKDIAKTIKECCTIVSISDFEQVFTN